MHICELLHSRTVLSYDRRTIVADEADMLFADATNVGSHHEPTLSQVHVNNSKKNGARRITGSIVCESCYEPSVLY